jgi:hypothetical protein
MEALARKQRFWDRDVSFVIQIEINYAAFLYRESINFLHTRVRSINFRLLF